MLYFRFPRRTGQQHPPADPCTLKTTAVVYAEMAETLQRTTRRHPESGHHKPVSFSHLSIKTVQQFH
jgi:hypothetical protein